MANPLLTFNAKSVDAEILEQTLVGRKEILDRLEKELISKVKNKFTYQCLIIAPRGGGKSHMIQVLYNRLKENKSISNKILIAYMVEDETGIANFLDFMLRILESFIRYKEVNSKNLKEAIFEISDIAIQHQEAAIKNLLLDYIGNKTLIVLIENLNIVFEGMKTDGQAKLRDFMHENNKISLVATSQNLFAQVQKSDYPFYNFFKTHHLEKLNYRQSLELVQAIASVDTDKTLIKKLQESKTLGKFRAIYELTEGNHRLLVSFYSFLKAEIKSDLSQVFIKTMNDLKPYYEQFIKKLPVQEQKIVKHLSLKHKPQKGKDIARSCFIPPNIISKQLSELYNKGHIDKHKEGKDAYYELKEPLMRICFEINESPDGIAKLFVDFLSVIYTSQELKTKYLKFRYAAKLQPVEIREKYRREALMMSKAIDPKILEELRTHPGLEKFKTEKEIEDYLIETKMEYFDLGLGEKQSIRILRQFNLDPYGIVDILTFGNYNSPIADENIIDINIFEIKNEPIHLKQLSQLYRYADGIRVYTENFKLKENQYINITPHLIIPFFDETDNNLIYLIKALSDDVGMRKYTK
ncbi:MAG: hypothetical protein IIB82_16895, partial [Bacteroidetes bacterium]|nr:hypothetical protein [Bacteroidota bacterium]